MSDGVRRVAMVSMHTSPAAPPGRGDAGGMNVALLALARQLALRGVEVDLLTRATAAPEVVRLGVGVTLRTLEAGPLVPMPKSGLTDVADEFGEAVASLVGRSAPRYDLLHAHYWLSGLATLPVAIELGLPFVQSFHTLGAMKNRLLAPGDVPEPEGRLRGEAFLVTQADAVVAGSAAEVSSLIDELHAPADRLWVIPPGVDTELFTPGRSAAAGAVRERLGLEAERPLLVVAGRIQPLKDQELAIRALAGVHALRGWAPLLVIAGESSDADYLRRLGDTAAELGVAKDVRFVGALDRESLAELLAAAAVTLVTSQSETFGLIALESASSGTPVVAFRGTGLIESVSDGESGLLLDSRDPRVWAGAVSGLLDDQVRLARLGASARGFAEGFTWATAGASLLAVYESLVAARR
jgi:D-inositol-3-phosphate glycosyltransferase